MLTPLIMLALLMLPWLLAALGRASPVRRRSAASFGLALVFIFTGIGHFLAPEAMARLIPPAIPLRVPIIYITGLLELALAAALLDRRSRCAAGWIALALLAGFLPFNIYAALNRIPFGGHEWGPAYLLIRVPLQIVLAAWAWRFVARNPTDRSITPLPRSLLAFAPRDPSP